MLTQLTPSAGLELLHRGTLPVTAFLPVERQQDGRRYGAGLADQVDGFALGGAVGNHIIHDD